MKTITLDEVAYARLKAWKRGPCDSFSRVVRRVVPMPGTLSSFAGFGESHGTDRLTGNAERERAVDARPTGKGRPVAYVADTCLPVAAVAHEAIRI